jgi:hypothetical protein
VALATLAVFLFFTPQTAAPQTCLAPPSGMVAWWPGDGNANEIVSGRNGSIIGSAGFAPGMVADAFSFDGNGWIEVADDPIWTLGTEDFTIDLWVRFNTLGGRDPFIAHDNTSGEQNKWIFWYDGLGHDKQPGVPALRFHINSPHPAPVPFPHDTVVAPWSPVLGRWYHVAVTRSGITYVLYIDGAQVATDTSTFSIPDPTATLTIGRAEGFRLNGLVDEVEIFERALSASEIQALFAAGSAGKCKNELLVTIDIKPGSFPNSINPRNNGVIPVAILTTNTFNAATVSPTTVRFGPTGTEAAPVQFALEDVDGDGDVDLILHFNTEDTGIVCGVTSAAVGGRTTGGQPIRGTDSVRTVGCR